MLYASRRRFLYQSAILMASGITGVSFNKKKAQPLLSFSTLGCPDWTFDQIVSFAKQHQYKGIEVRGILREMDLTKSPVFDTAEHRNSTLQMMKDNDLRFIDLGSSCTLHFAEGEERQKNLDEGKRFIDLAQQVHCPYIRVFPNLFPKEQTKEAAMDWMSKGLLELGEHAKGSEVKVLVESHGDLVHTDDLLKVMQAAKHPNTGMVWDVTNMWIETGEAPKMVYEKLKPYIYHTHIKDAKKMQDAIQYKLMGEGEVPIFEAIDILRSDGYNGYYSFEWEKLWHPEIAAPEIALADYPQKMIQHFTQHK